jgi:hypothetical protein
MIISKNIKKASRNYKKEVSLHAKLGKRIGLLHYINNYPNSRISYFLFIVR